MFIIMKRDAFQTLIGKVSAVLYSLPVETHIITRCIAGDQGHTQGVCAVFVDYLQRDRYRFPEIYSSCGPGNRVPDRGSDTVWNGVLAGLLALPENTIRITQKKMMSYPVTSTSVG